MDYQISFESGFALLYPTYLLDMSEAHLNGVIHSLTQG